MANSTLETKISTLYVAYEKPLAQADKNTFMSISATYDLKLETRSFRHKYESRCVYKCSKYCFMDYKHFNGNQSIGQNRSLFKCFNLLPYYLAVPTIVLQKPTQNTMTKGIS
jgi:hypothetical protein